MFTNHIREKKIRSELYCKSDEENFFKDEKITKKLLQDQIRQIAFTILNRAGFMGWAILN